jgi:hypothetical protein
VGVALENGRFAAHAWVEFAGEVFGDYETHVRKFATLTDVSLHERS